jgi:hypothetical protein
MGRLPLPALVGVVLALTGCAQAKNGQRAETPITGPIKVELDLKDPSMSFGVMPRGGDRLVFKVGSGRHGITCAGSRFEEGYTPLGTFKVNAILSNDRFAMDPTLIAESGQSEAKLKQTLFASMNAIDFDGDGETGEYGIGYISLAPVDSVKQPFGFNRYAGTFRWYSFAIHGSNNDQRIGQKVTGGCLNVAEPELKTLLRAVRLGDEVQIRANGPCAGS